MVWGMRADDLHVATIDNTATDGKSAVKKKSVELPRISSRAGLRDHSGSGERLHKPHEHSPPLGQILIG